MIYEKGISDKIIGCAIEVHKQLGNGFLEKIYENALLYELKMNGLKASSQQKIEVQYKGQLVGDYYADIFVENMIILELKVCSKILNLHKAQLLNYLNATEIKLGYIINFGNPTKLEFQRLVR